MPYIAPEKRPHVDPHLDAITDFITCEGDLNYAFTVLAHNYIRSQGLRYERLGDITGGLVNCLLEYYFEIVRPYEAIKKRENGDVNRTTLEGFLDPSQRGPGKPNYAE